MFSDLNRYAIRPSKSLGVLYDHRDEAAELAREIAFNTETFSGVVEMERSTLSPRSSRLFTLSSIYNATLALLSGIETKDFEERTDIAAMFWNETGKHIKEWRLVKDRKITSGDVRRDFIHSHAVVLQAIGKVGNALLKNEIKDWKAKLRKLKSVDWTRRNSRLWEGRAMIGGRVSKAQHNVTLTTSAIKKHLEIELTPEEQKVEEAFSRGDFKK